MSLIVDSTVELIAKDARARAPAVELLDVFVGVGVVELVVVGLDRFHAVCANSRTGRRTRIRILRLQEEYDRAGQRKATAALRHLAQVQRKQLAERSESRRDSDARYRKQRGRK